VPLVARKLFFFGGRAHKRCTSKVECNRKNSPRTCDILIVKLFIFAITVKFHCHLTETAEKSTKWFVHFLGKFLNDVMQI
jgi:hypothetical protein